MDDSLSVTLTLAPDASGRERETYASKFDGFDDPFLHTQKSAQHRRGTWGGRSPLSLLKAFWVFGIVARREGRCRETPMTFLAGQALVWLIVELVLACDLHSQNVSRCRILRSLRPKHRPGLRVDSRVSSSIFQGSVSITNCRVDGHRPR